MSTDSPFNILYDAVAKKKLETVITLYRRGKDTRLRIEARQIVKKDQTKVIDYEEVKKSERVEDAAERFHARLKRDRVHQLPPVRTSSKRATIRCATKLLTNVIASRITPR